MLWQKDLCEENVVEKTVRLVSKFKKLNGSNISPLFNSGIVTKTRYVTLFVYKFFLVVCVPKSNMGRYKYDYYLI